MSFALAPDIYLVRLGDIIKVKSGIAEVEFVSFRGKKFIGIMNGTSYKFSNEDFEKIIRKAERSTGWKTLKKDEPFYFSHKGVATVAIFKNMNHKGQIEAECPISKMQWFISTSSYFGRITDLLPKEEPVEA
jgi:hypothetical protein